jgi:hypothetical protein
MQKWYNNIVKSGAIDKLISRFKSFVWRYGAYVVIGLLAFVSENMGLLQLHPQIVILLSYIIGEVTKYINNKYLKAI